MVAKTEKKNEKTSLGSKILDYVPWRKALTIAAFAISVVGALAYGNYRKNNRTENPASNNGPDESNNKESKKRKTTRLFRKTCISSWYYCKENLCYCDWLSA